MTVCQVEGSRAPILRPPLLVAPMPLAGGLQTAEPKVDAGFVPSFSEITFNHRGCSVSATNGMGRWFNRLILGCRFASRSSTSC
jgi:hypothetical protein